MRVRWTLKMLRIRDDMTQKELAEKLGVSTDTWGHWERGQTEPSVGQAYEIANFFNVSIDDIIFLKQNAV